MRKLFIKFTTFCIALISVFLISSCEHPFKPEYIPEQDLEINYAEEYVIYEYSDRVLVQLYFTGNEKDFLQINGHLNILETDFDKVAYNQGNLFIVTNDKYYMFDINNFINDPKGELPSPSYQLNEYSFEEFKDLYPNYEKFEWYGLSHPIIADY